MVMLVLSSVLHVSSRLSSESNLIRLRSLLDDNW